MEGSSMLEHIMGYFGTYTPAADGAIATFQFKYLTTLGFAAIVIFLGRAIVAHSALLRKYCNTGSGYFRYHLFCCCIYHQGFRNHRFFL